MTNKEPLRGLNLALEANPWGTKGSLQTTLRFLPSLQGSDDGDHVGRCGHDDPEAGITERS